MTSRGRIICGFAGIGKSTLAKMRANVVDLESTPFQKDWVTYARVAEHMKNNGYTVLVSCHNGLRTKLHKNGVEYDVVLPNPNLKESFMQRYIRRGNTEDFVKRLSENWEVFCKELPWELAIRIGTEFLADILPTLDVVEYAPVVHGKWEKAEDDYYGLNIIKCSLCREEWCFEVEDDVMDLNYKHCPNCGAKMDLEVT